VQSSTQFNEVQHEQPNQTTSCWNTFGDWLLFCNRIHIFTVMLGGGCMRMRTLYVLIVASYRDAHSQVFYSRNTAEHFIKCRYNSSDKTWIEFVKYLEINHPQIKVTIQEIGMEL
jgi:hypothetical protein